MENNVEKKGKCDKANTWELREKVTDMQVNLCGIADLCNILSASVESITPQALEAIASAITNEAANLAEVINFLTATMEEKRAD